MDRGDFINRIRADKDLLGAEAVVGIGKEITTVVLSLIDTVLKDNPEMSLKDYRKLLATGFGEGVDLISLV